MALATLLRENPRVLLYTPAANGEWLERGPARVRVRREALIPEMSRLLRVEALRFACNPLHSARV